MVVQKNFYNFFRKIYRTAIYGIVKKSNFRISEMHDYGIAYREMRW